MDFISFSLLFYRRFRICLINASGYPIPLFYFSDKDYTHFVRTSFRSPCPAGCSVLYFLVITGEVFAVFKSEAGLQ